MMNEVYDPYNTLHSKFYRADPRMTFSDVFTDVEDFLDAYHDCGIENTISDTSCRNLYFLLISRYVDRAIAPSNVNQFVYGCMARIFQYGPTWEKRLAIQKELRDADIEDLRASMAIMNQANNPPTSPITTDITGIGHINSQNVTHSIRNPLDTYAGLETLLRTDVTGEFLSRFEDLFSTLSIGLPLYYTTEVNEDD